MSKSEGDFIGLLDSPEEMYGKTMALPDEAVVQVFIDSTDVSLDEIKNIEKEIDEGGNPRDVKMRLARELVAFYHDKETARDAEEHFIKTFQKKEFPDDAREIVVQKETLLKDMLVGEQIIESHSAFKRLIEQGAIRNITRNKKIDDINFKIVESSRLKVGKRKFLKVTLQ